MTPHEYCTYFDSAYAARGRVLVESLRTSGDPGRVHVLALDDATFDEVETWKHMNVNVLRLEHLEADFPELLAAKADRSRLEYVFTLTPWLTRWVMAQAAESSWVTYLDADMAFYSSTTPIYDSANSGSVAIVEHRFTWEQRWRAKYGRFNVAWVGFRNDPHGQRCLDWWATRCLDWCRDEVSEGRFADQGYLDRFPELFEGVVVINLPGADVAPWNLRRHKLSVEPNGRVLVDGSPLIFYHFHGLKSDGNRFYFKHVPYLVKTTAVIRDHIYSPYCTALERATPEGLRSLESMNRNPTLLGSLKPGRAAILRWLAVWRGDSINAKDN